jgi:hypothetical protein
MCLRGSSEVERTVLSRIHSKDLIAFVVWVPQLGGTNGAAIQASRILFDSRTEHYWDGSDVTGREFSEVLKTPGPAWDVYLLYAPGVRWASDLPPMPTYWMQQLGMPDAPSLNASVLAEHVQTLTEAHSHQKSPGINRHRTFD